MPQRPSAVSPPVRRLVAHETSSHPTDADVSCAPSTDADAIACSFRHSGWASIRSKVAASIERVDGQGQRLNRFERCGSSAWVVESIAEPGTYALAGDACRDRMCLPCAQWRASRVAAALTTHVADKPLLFVTLTLADAYQHADGSIATMRPDAGDASSWTRIPLESLVRKLYRSFAALRRCDFWRSSVAGGAAMLELKWSPRKGRWHPHLHMMLEARFVDQADLRAAWYRITKTSTSIDVQRVRDRDNAVRECCKYASKPVCHSYADDPALLDEAIAALRGKRFCNTFGTWRGLRLTDPPEDAKWIRRAPLRTILNQAEHGNPEAIAILDYLAIARPRERAPPPIIDAPEQLRMWDSAAPTQWA